MNLNFSRRGLFAAFAGLTLAPKAALLGSAAPAAGAITMAPGAWGASDLTYEWFANGERIEGANGPEFSGMIASKNVGDTVSVTLRISPKAHP